MFRFRQTKLLVDQFIFVWTSITRKFLWNRTRFLNSQFHWLLGVLNWKNVQILTNICMVSRSGDNDDFHILTVMSIIGLPLMVLALMPHLFDYKCYSWNELSALSFWPPIWLLCFLNWNSWGDALTKYIIFFQSATQSHIIYTLHCFCDTAGKLNYLIPNCLSFSFVSCLHCQTGFLLLHLICNFLKVDMFGSFEFRSQL